MHITKEDLERLTVPGSTEGVVVRIVEEHGEAGVEPVELVREAQDFGLPDTVVYRAMVSLLDRGRISMTSDVRLRPEVR